MCVDTWVIIIEYLSQKLSHFDGCCRFLKNKQTKDAKLHEYLDDSMIRERMRRRMQVEMFRERLDEAASKEAQQRLR